MSVKGAAEQEFIAFVRDRGDRLLRFARLLILDPGDAEDALQLALLRLVKHWSRGVKAPEAYVRATLVNLAKDGARRKHLVPVPVDTGPREEACGDHAEAFHAQARLDLLLSQLPPRQRTTVVLRVIEGCSEAETAQLMRCSAGTVKSNLARGLASLRKTATTPQSLEEAQQ